MKRRIVLLGPPASGKGTLAARIASTFGIPATSTGALLRAQRDSPQGREAKRHINAGELVPDPIILTLVRDWLSQHGADSFLFDGFPRTAGQADRLDAALEALQRPLSLVLLLEVSEEQIRERVLARLTCVQCGAVARAGATLDAGGICTVCGGRMERRSDDTAEALDQRLESYEILTRPLIRRYETAGLLARIDGGSPGDEVFARAGALLEET